MSDRVFIDGSRMTDNCKCDTACTHCAGEGCERCEGTGSRRCEFPCWERIGLTAEPCCPDCSPLPEAENEHF